MKIKFQNEIHGSIYLTPSIMIFIGKNICDLYFTWIKWSICFRFNKIFDKKDSEGNFEKDVKRL